MHDSTSQELASRCGLHYSIWQMRDSGTSRGTGLQRRWNRRAKGETGTMGDRINRSGSTSGQERDLITREIQCKSILTKSGIEGVDYAINPYVGCAHGCAYCYAVFMKRFTGHKEEWGTFVDVKVNAPQVLSRQLRRAKPGNVTFGTVTDAYQPLERVYELTRACLEVLARSGQGFSVSILTKSDLVLRDLDMIEQLKDAEVAFTITTLDEEIRRRFESHASSISARLEALRSLHETGIRTWAFCGPVLPSITDDEASLDALFAELKRVGVGYVLVDSLNVRGAAWGRLHRVLKTHYPDLVDTYRVFSSRRAPYHQALLEKTRRIAERYDLPLRGIDLPGAGGRQP
jgi:DNA repair photolyase